MTMVLTGVAPVVPTIFHDDGSERTRAPIGPVSPQTRAGLIELARRRDPLVLRWAR